MIISNLLTDEAILREIGGRVQRRRIQMQLSQAELAVQAGVSKRTIERIEDGASAQLSTLIRILRVLELLAGLEQMLPAGEPGPIELLHNQGKVRQRVGRRRKTGVRESAWTWNDET